MIMKVYNIKAQKTGNKCQDWSKEARFIEESLSIVGSFNLNHDPLVLNLIVSETAPLTAK
jgi:hypothetical protein